MSHHINEDLIELAHEHSLYWEGTLMQKLIDFDLERGDLEGLEAHLKESAAIMFQREYNPDGPTQKINRGFNLEAVDTY